MDELFEGFKDQLRMRGYELNSGQIVDSSIVEVPRQRNSREDNATVKSGEVPEDWKGAAEQAAAKRHRCALDEEARLVLLRLQEPCVGGPRHETH